MATRRYSVHRIDSRCEHPRTYSVPLPDGEETEVSRAIADFSTWVSDTLAGLDLFGRIRYQTVETPAEKGYKALKELYMLAAKYDYDVSSDYYDTVKAALGITTP